eukprot:TRINITY_DN39606_c0_g1_i1.p1 TRINITY_DN39606_c0_g1~~TRINITY_DN39606_c0_g1_i1.p1  ORF type:complete len:753 (-),score=146.90 TRINITY_DN39606_c0_g1_i1:230-2224(-)
MEEELLPLNEVSYNVALTAFNAEHQWQRAALIAEDMQAFGLQLKNIGYTALIGAAGKSGQWQWALHFLDDADQFGRPDVYLFNSGIGACQESAQPGAAWQVFEDMRKKDIQPDAVSYHALMASQEWEVATQLLEQMQQNGLRVTAVSYSSLITAMRKDSNWESVCGVLHRMRDLQTPPDLFLYAGVMGALEDMALWQRSLSVLEEMRSAALQPDLAIHNSALRSMQAQRQSESAEVLLRDMREKLVEADAASFSAAMGAYADGEWLHALKLLQGMEEADIRKDTSTYHAVLGLLGSAGEWQRALLCFWKFVSEGCELDTTAYNMAMHMYASAALWQEALELLTRLSTSTSLEVSRVSFNTVIEAAGACKKWDLALGLVDQMEEQRLIPDAVTYLAAIGACGKALQWTHVLDLLNRAAASCESWQELSPPCAEQDTVNMLNAAVGALAKAQQSKTAMSVFHETYSQFSVKVDVLSYLSALAACDSGRDWTLALELLQDARRSTVELALETYNAAIAAMRWGPGQWRRALGLMDDMTFAEVLPDIVTFNAAIYATDCEITGRQNPLADLGAWQACLSLLGRMAEQDVLPNHLTFNGVLASLVRGERWQHVLDVLQMMDEQRADRDVLTYLHSVLACELGLQWGTAVELLYGMHAKALALARSECRV